MGQATGIFVVHPENLTPIVVDGLGFRPKGLWVRTKFTLSSQTWDCMGCAGPTAVAANQATSILTLSEDCTIANQFTGWPGSLIDAPPLLDLRLASFDDDGFTISVLAAGILVAQAVMFYAHD